ncbi:Orn/Lys/Arg decarboxylase N-terminal domain-containing protein [Salinisphaera hydrothermalis]|uniref:Ornithine decarboxylase n=1 Tax=Salinisphaera hydrothermalis (strain C41B8) TaxID=1304275 RepID=A0A084IKH7_SALHC|nr:Orn/Lys/Arg decarboxylase N-terminal domain-containing protein [Salinisphaera hydrothermalis]KEZ77211.1 ornithine decarboxylase [Salinisphaera hydrothermalis C41B8]
MSYHHLFQFLFFAPGRERDTAEQRQLQHIVDALADLAYDVVRAGSFEETRFLIRSNASFGCLVLQWDREGGDTADTEALVAWIRDRGLECPIFLLTERMQLAEIAPGTLDRVTGTIFLAEDSPPFIAENLARHLDAYAESLKTPFFGAMVDYAAQGNQVWTCPGHNGGVFYSKSPIGRVFVEHFGEAIFRNDLDNSVVELGDLLTHEGPALAAQREAAKIFGADRTYFVLNGTSTSNKIVLSSLVGHDDLVLFDRNNHKSAHHGALVLAGGIPVYLPTQRNGYGLIGPIDYDALDEARIRQAIREHPQVTDPAIADRPRPFRVAVVEQCSYDGSIYNARMILEKLGPLCDYILFDEAWAGFMKFHPLFADHFAMGLAGLGADQPGIIATQSTHKQLAGFSQASQIHVRDAHITGQKRCIEHRRFNEMYMLHASTSPYYPLFASLDVGAQMMKGRSGQVLWDETIRLGIELRKKIRQLKRHYEATESDPARRWFFDPFVPDQLRLPRSGVWQAADEAIAWEDVETERLASDPACWALAPDAAWHGFRHLAPDYAMTDPNKLTLLTPGLDPATGAYADHGIAAAVVAQYLREQGIVPEKNDLNSLLFLLTPGLESSKAGTLLSALMAFKRLHDANAPLAEVIPAFVAAHGDRYAGLGLRDLCAEMHAFYRDADTAALQRDQFRAAHFPEIALTPKQATDRLIANDVDFLPIDDIEGRIAATLALVYPPGIGVVVPGERYDAAARPMLDYFRMFEAAANRFPGFANEIQGLYAVTEDGRTRLYTYVVQE